MLGAIVGDVTGSVHEYVHMKRKDFDLFANESTFTDDTVLTVAVADAVLRGIEYGPTIKAYAKRYPSRGYGMAFLDWMARPGLKPYNSYGNGSAMRVSPVAHAFSSEDAVLVAALKTAECTHNHPEGIKGAQATALAVFMARCGADKKSIRSAVEERFAYDLSRTVDAVRPRYGMDITCQGSVPESIIAFLDSESFEDAVRNAVSLGGDADTQACIAGAIAEAYYKDIPSEILRETAKRLAKPLWAKTLEFYGRFGIPEIVEQLDSLDAK